MNDPLFAEFLLAVQELLGAIERIEQLGTPDRIDRFRFALENVRSRADAIALRAAPLFFFDVTALPEPIAPDALGNGLPEVPFIIPDVTRCADTKEEFRAIWNDLSGHGICDQWGGAESTRVLDLWNKEGRPKEAARFIVFHANSPTR